VFVEQLLGFTRSG
jgi:hypothetical protein